LGYFHQYINYILIDVSTYKGQTGIIYWNIQQKILSGDESDGVQICFWLA
jgi:hypothetical protein